MLELPVLAGVRKRLFRRPRPHNEREPLFESFIGLRHGDTEAGEFIVAVTFAPPQFEPAVGHEVDSGGLLGAQDGVLPMAPDAPRARPQPNTARPPPPHKSNPSRDSSTYTQRL